MISGNNKSYICDNCIKLSHKIMEDFNIEEEKAELINIKNLNIPDLYSFLNQFVIGQDKAKKILSVAVYNHYKKIMSNHNDKSDDISIDKSNILMIGNTGSGKTFLIKNLAKYLDIPMVICDATSLTETGYAGQDVETIMSRLIQAADYNVTKASYGMVYIDEIDKISKKNLDSSNRKDISGEGVQQALLKMIEESTIYAPNLNARHNSKQQEVIPINTANILFIFGGSFNGLENIISKRLNHNTIGFSTNKKAQQELRDNMNSVLNTEDLVSFGLIPEFCGRMPVHVVLDNINIDTLIDIMKKPKNSIIKQYQKLFSLSDVKIDFDDSAIEEIAQQAFALKTGARGIKSIIEKELLEVMFDINNFKNKNLKIYCNKNKIEYKTIT